MGRLPVRFISPGRSTRCIELDAHRDAFAARRVEVQFEVDAALAERHRAGQFSLGPVHVLSAAFTFEHGTTGESVDIVFPQVEVCVIGEHDVFESRMNARHRRNIVQRRAFVGFFRGLGGPACGAVLEQAARSTEGKRGLQHPAPARGIDDETLGRDRIGLLVAVPGPDADVLRADVAVPVDIGAIEAGPADQIERLHRIRCHAANADIAEGQDDDQQQDAFGPPGPAFGTSCHVCSIALQDASSNATRQGSASRRR